MIYVKAMNTLLTYKLMQVVSEELGALIASMTIVDPEEGAFGPILHFSFLALWLHDVQYDRHPVFIVVPDYPLVSISAIGGYDTVSLP